MILPNKLIPFKDSILAKSIAILEQLEVESVHIGKLYIKVKNHFNDINQYIIALDILFVLEKIEYDKRTQVVSYVDKNKL
jgi:hypothetical protein